MDADENAGKISKKQRHVILRPEANCRFIMVSKDVYKAIVGGRENKERHAVKFRSAAANKQAYT